MEAMVEEYLDDIANYAARPTLALYAASRLADACIAGRVENWRDVRSTVWLIPNPWRLRENRAVCLFEDKLWNYTPTALDAARDRYLLAQSAPREPLTGTAEDIDHSDPGYWQSVNGDLSAADGDAEEKFE